MFSILKHLLTPHRTNNHRPRLLHPMGLVVLMLVALSGGGAVNVLEHQPPQGLVLGYASNINAYDVLVQTNQERENNGLAPLVMSDHLSAAAQAKAQDMFAKNYWAHVSPDGVPPWSFIRDAGYRYSVAGENLARDFDSTQPMVAAWMASPTHKDNILHARYSETGIAVVNGNLEGIDTTLVVQMFGAPIRTVALNEESSFPPAQISDQGVVSQEPQVEIAEPNLPETAPVVLSQPTTVLSQANEEQSAARVYVSPLDIKKSIVLSVILLIMAVLVIDEIIIRHRKTARFVGRNLAHMSFLVLALLIVINIIQPGAVQ